VDRHPFLGPFFEDPFFRDFFGNRQQPPGGMPQERQERSARTLEATSPSFSSRTSARRNSSSCTSVTPMPSASARPSSQSAIPSDWRAR
jgi:hypothetical protein